MGLGPSTNTSARPKTDKHLRENNVIVLMDGELRHMDKLLNLDYVFYNTTSSYYAGQDSWMEVPLKLISRLALPPGYA